MEIKTIPEKICIREVNENIRLVELGQPLTMSLRVLNTSCQFRKKFNEFDKRINPHKATRREREYKREYNNKPEVKAKRKEYNNKPEVKAKKRAYHQKPEVKAMVREYQRAYRDKNRLIKLKVN